MTFFFMYKPSNVQWLPANAPGAGRKKKKKEYYDLMDPDYLEIMRELQDEDDMGAIVLLFFRDLE